MDCTRLYCEALKEYSCDLHFHGLYAGGVSDKMLIPVIAEQAKAKGLELVCTGDIQHAKWIEHVRESILEEENGVFTDNESNANFIISTEVETNDRVHSLAYFPDFQAAEQFREKIRKFGSLDCTMCGRPKLRLKPEQVAEIAFDLGAIIGPSHAFTPYTGMYAHYDSVEAAYGGQAKKIDFIELGLSADTYFADLIGKNHNYTFLSSSDAHSPWPHRLGREFNRIKLAKPDFKSLKRALHEREERLVTLNAGLDPREGKYHCSACNSCYAKYSPEDSKRMEWRCPKCGGSIKKGVRDRIMELADHKNEIHPSFRPDYVHILPLAEIIQLSLGLANPASEKVQEKWRQFVQALGNEIKVLLEAKPEELFAVDKKIAEYVLAFRNGWVLYVPGGGGNYGKPIICLSEKEFELKKIGMKEELGCEGRKSGGQKILSEF